jgi:hypothetical protein
MIKITQKERDQEANAIVAEICQNGTAGKDRFFLKIFCCSNRKVQI